MTHNNIREEMIYYTGIGSNNLSIVSEKLFRNMVLTNINNFNELCHYDPLVCDIKALTEWTGAEIIN
jgi:hypothetical protein